MADINTVQAAVPVLQAMITTNLLWQASPGSTTAESLIVDGRCRKRLWRELRQAGYITEDGKLTSKAYDEIEVPDSTAEISTLYTFDEYTDSRQRGKPHVSWAQLTFSQRKLLLERHKQDPAAVTFLVYDTNAAYDQRPFQPGEAISVVKSLGFYYSYGVGVRDTGLQAKRDAAALEHRVAVCRNSGLNWYLRKVAAIEPEEEVPVLSRHGLLAAGPAMPVDPSQWSQSLAGVIQGTKDRIFKYRQQLVTLEKLESYVESCGGWDNFTAAFDEAVRQYVNEEQQTVAV